VYTSFYIFLSLVIVVIDAVLLYVNRRNPAILVLNLGFLIFDYSICAGEYLYHNYLVPKNGLYSTVFGNLYEHGLIVFFIFVLLRYFYFRRRIPMIFIKRKESPIIFYGLYIMLLYIGIFEVNREPSIFYEVKITPVYEYSVILFLLIIKYSGDSKIKQVMVLFIATAFVAQDIYYGGRVTSAQIIIVIGILLFPHVVRLKNILITLPFIYVMSSFIGSYRGNRGQGMDWTSFYIELTERFMIFNTSLYAYFASMGHLYSEKFVGFQERILSFLGFLLSVLFGSLVSAFTDIDMRYLNVTKFSNMYHWNVGGGLIFTWFHFWLGPFGLVLFSVLVFKIILSFSRHSRNYIYLVALVATFPRWYLYSPLAFIRGPLIFLPLISFTLIVSHGIIRKLFFHNGQSTKKVN